MDKLTTLTREEQADVIAQYLPNNPCFIDKNIDNTVLRNILLGLASQWMQVRSYNNEVYNEYNPETTTKYISEWEQMVGIPNECIPIANTLEERRKFILLKLAGLYAETEQQIINIASILGLSITISKGEEASVISENLTIPFILIGEKQAPFTIVINITAGNEGDTISDELIIPFTIIDDITDVFACLIVKIKQANTFIVINYA